VDCFPIPPGYMRWQRERFKVACGVGSHGYAEEVAGYTYRGLGLHWAMDWAITHLNTGHVLCYCRGGIKRSFAAATELAERFDWSFDGLQGWRNLDPEMSGKVLLWMRANPDCYRTTGQQHEAVARRIAVERW
jgi:hypothetical protein